MEPDEENRRWRAALSGADVSGVEALVREDLSLRLLAAELLGSVEPAETAALRGLLLRGGEGTVLFPAGNPWGISADHLAGALEQLWAPVAERCPGLVRALRDEVLAVVLVEMGGRWLLGYLYLERRDAPPPRHLRDLGPYERFAPSVLLLWGTAPTVYGPDQVVPALGEPLPPGVRDLAAIHADLRSFDVDVRLDRFMGALGTSLRAHYDGEDPADYAPDDEFTRALNGEFDRWIGVSRCDSAVSADYVTMDRRDPDGAPMMAWKNQDETGGHQRFWDWADFGIPSLVFCL